MRSRSRWGLGWVVATAAALSLVVAGCGATTITVTAPAVTAPADTSPPTGATSTTEPSSTNGTGPVVEFVDRVTGAQAGNWPFTAQLVMLETNVNGFGAGNTHAENQTYLMVQVAVTDRMPGQLPPIPQLNVVCNLPRAPNSAYNDGTGEHGPLDAFNSTSWGTGYDGGSETDPDPMGTEVSMGDGQPHDWDEEWLVPARFSASDVKCRLESGAPEPELGDIEVQGSGALN